MEIDAAGWLQGVRQVVSPNCDCRPPGVTIDLVVIHAISLPAGEFGGPHVEALFTNRLAPDAHPSFTELTDLRVSAHALIARNGALTQYVPFLARAWHAGRSKFRGRSGCNDFSIGIELEGADDRVYTAAQYGVLTGLRRTLMRRWPRITPARIVGHCDVAPGRKTDPGSGFDWSRLRSALAASSTPRGADANRACGLAQSHPY
jgi:N-acetyl-anhydromuramoyl-L-alanine amidase